MLNFFKSLSEDKLFNPGGGVNRAIRINHSKVHQSDWEKKKNEQLQKFESGDWSIIDSPFVMFGLDLNKANLF